ncbi:MAG: anti-sigma factor family protein [Armatimonadota bacterium]
MSCKQIKQILPDYEVGALRPDRRAAVEAHLAGCHACRAELRLLRETGALLARAPSHEPPADLWQRVQREIAAPQPLGWGQRLRHFLAPPVRRLALAAAVVTAAAAIGLVLWLAPLRAPEHAPMVTALDEEGIVYDGYQAAAAWRRPFADRAALGVVLASMSNGRGTQTR